MRFKFDKTKSKLIKNNPKRGIDFRSDDPEQFRAIGWVKGKLYSVVFEVREDAKGEFYHLITLWKSTKEEIKLYEKNV